MSTLNAYRRRELPSNVFGLPEQRKYPMHDKNHAIAAKSRATQQYRRGNLSKEQYEAIFAKANRRLGK